MRTIRYTAQFKRDYKREKRGQYKKNLDYEFVSVVQLLAIDDRLPEILHDHSLSGNLKDFRDCHIKPDLVLIYRKIDNDALELIRLGSHSELGL